MACVSKIGSLYELVTKNVVVTTTNTVDELKELLIKKLG